MTRLKETIKKILKPTVFKITALLLVLDFLFYSCFPAPTAIAATLNPGSNFTACAGQAVQPFYTTHSNPSVTVYWTFASTVGNTQAAYRIQIDDDAAFGSPLETGTVSDANARSYATSTSALVFSTRYYWRLIITDNNSSVTDWIDGDSFITNKPSLKLQGGLKLRGGVKLK